MTTVVGAAGRAEQVGLGTGQQFAETVCWWLVTAPPYHPLWSQYALMVVRLRDDVPGFPPPVRQFPGASHELMVLALNPEHGPHLAAEVATGFVDGHHPPFLMGPNIVAQFEATDGEMASLAGLCCQGVVDGWLNPETGDAPERIREEWLTTMVKTLAHLRGEEHAP